jgi:dCMP deaminase
MNTIDNKWDSRFIDLAYHIAQWSKDPSTKVGAVIVDEQRRIISTGYNGFPQKLHDSPERYLNREQKYEMIIHGEINAILFAQRPLHGCTLYTVPLLPCSRCAAIVIQSGISRVCAPEYLGERWKQSLELSKNMFKEANIEVVEFNTLMMSK